MASKGNVFTALGASNHTDKERQKEDYYATDPRAAEMLLQVETFPGKVWECACGEKHLANVFEQHGYTVRSSDIVNRCGNEVFDFLSMNNTEWGGVYCYQSSLPAGLRLCLPVPANRPGRAEGRHVPAAPVPGRKGKAGVLPELSSQDGVCV